MQIKPIEYYDQENGGSIPVFKPTWDQFKDFNKFVSAIDGYGKMFGIVKVIPPIEWKQTLPSIVPKLESIRVRNPIVTYKSCQAATTTGNRGIYRQTNIEKPRPFTLNQWRTMCNRLEIELPLIQQCRSSTFIPRVRRSLTGSAKKKRKFIIAQEIALAKSETPVEIDFDPATVSSDYFNEKTCRDIERNYWRNLTFSQPMYGADMEGTLFDDSVKAWNVASLDNLLNSVDIQLPGVNTPYLYFGMWKATFAWHVEDMDLYSINYLHFGCPKQWYAVKPEYKPKFEAVMQNIFSQDYKQCKEFLRHKTSIVSPNLLANNGVPIQRCVQHQGEFIITFPHGYHAGYNLGFNCAESVNFALDSWVSIGKLAKSCHCVDDSVRIDISIFERKRRRA